MHLIAFGRRYRITRKLRRLRGWQKWIRHRWLQSSASSTIISSRNQSLAKMKISSSTSTVVRKYVIVFVWNIQISVTLLVLDGLCKQLYTDAAASYYIQITVIYSALKHVSLKCSYNHLSNRRCLLMSILPHSGAEMCPREVELSLENEQFWLDTNRNWTWVNCQARTHHLKPLRCGCCLTAVLLIGQQLTTLSGASYYVGHWRCISCYK